MEPLPQDSEISPEAKWKSVVKRSVAVLRYLTSGWRRKLIFAIFALISVGIIVRITLSNWDLLVGYEWRLSPIWLGYAVLAFIVDFLVSLWAWHALVSQLTGFRNFFRSTKIVLASNLARRMPGGIWYIASRAVLYEEEGIRKRRTSIVSALEMAFFFISSIVTVLAMLPFWSLPERIPDTLGATWILLLVALVGLIAVHPRVLQVLWRVTGLDDFPAEVHWTDTVAWLLLYTATWFLGGIVLFCIINFFTAVPSSELTGVIGVWALAGAISIMGSFTLPIIGLREITLIFLLEQFVLHPITLAVAVTVRLLWLTGELLTSLAALLR